MLSKPHRILITSGPTREYLDPVRFLTNASSGRMGAALACGVLERGLVPVVVSGQVAVEYPVGSEVHYVVATEEMLSVCRKLVDGCVGVIGAAAPCDFRSLSPSREKIHKSSDSVTSGYTNKLSLEFVETPDILRSLAEVKRVEQWIVAFALETNNCYERALQKLKRKGADYIAINNVSAIDAHETKLELMNVSGEIVRTLTGEKSVVARELLSFLYDEGKI
jgi:phosphopantothenoylcysteine decarboxylase/phosphopantothenate--cysteine ligase